MEMWSAIDVNDDGHLNYLEFCAAFQVHLTLNPELNPQPYNLQGRDAGSGVLPGGVGCSSYPILYAADEYSCASFLIKHKRGCFLLCNWLLSATFMAPF